MVKLAEHICDISLGMCEDQEMNHTTGNNMTVIIVLTGNGTTKVSVNFMTGMMT